MASASGSQDGNVNGLELSRFSDSVPVRRSRFKFDIFDERMSLWDDTESVKRGATPLGNIEVFHSIVKISPDNSKVLVYDHNSKSLVLFSSSSFREISRLSLGSGEVESQMSFSSDGTLVAVHVKDVSDKQQGADRQQDVNQHPAVDLQLDVGQHPAVENPTSGLLILSVPSLALVKRVPDNYKYHDKCSFIKGDNSRILILHPGDDSTTLYMYDLSTMSRVWEIGSLSDNVFALTEDCSKVFLSVILEKTSRGISKEFILADTTTGKRISSTVYPRIADYIDCAAFSEDGRKLVISIGRGVFIQVINLPEFAIVRKHHGYGLDNNDDDDDSDDECKVEYECSEFEGRFFTNQSNHIYSVIVSPNANWVIQVSGYNLFLFDIENKRPKRSGLGIGSSSHYGGLEISSDRSMMVAGLRSVVSLMHTRSRSERRLTAVLEAMLELMLASRKRRIRLPSEIWHIIFNEFIRDTLL